MSEKEVKDMTIEEAFEAIEETVARLETEDISLEDSFEEYKKGMELIKACTQKIDQVEKKVLELSENGEAHEFA